MSLEIDGKDSLNAPPTSTSKDEEAGERQMRVLIYTTSYNVIDG